MNINSTQISSSASQPLSSNAPNQASISQLISPGILPSSQPLLISGESRVKIVTQRREARRTRRRRREPSQHQPLAQRIRRRHMANQYRLQQQYYRNDRNEGRERHEREDPDFSDDMWRRPSAFGEHFEEVVAERLQEVYDWEMMRLTDSLEQEQLYEFDGIAALEQLSLVQNQLEQSYRIQTLQVLEQETQQTQERATEDSNQTQTHDIEDDLTLESLDSLLDNMNRMQQINDIHQTSGTNGQQ